MISEMDLAEVVGRSQRTVRRLRQETLEQGADWDYEGRKVVYSREGAERLLKAMDADMGVETLVERISGADDGVEGGEEVKWLAYRKTFPNKGIVGAEDPETGEMCRVSINRATRSKWVEGMRMKCVRLHDDLWRHCGRAPRFRGRY